MLNISENPPNVICTANIETALATYLQSQNVAVAVLIHDNWWVMTPFAVYTRLVSSTLRRQEVQKLHQQDFAKLTNPGLAPVDLATLAFVVPEVEIFEVVEDVTQQQNTASTSQKLSALKLQHDLCMFIPLHLFMVLTKQMQTQWVRSKSVEPIDSVQGWSQSAQLLSSLIDKARAEYP